MANPIKSLALNAAITCTAKLVSLKLCHCGALTAVYCTLFSGNHGRDAKSQRWLKIVAHGQNHGIHGNCESAFFLWP